MRLTRRQLRKLIKEVFLSDPASSALTDMSHAGRLRHVDDLGEELGQMARSDAPEDYRHAGDLYATATGDVEGGKIISRGPVPAPPPGSFSPSSRQAQELKAKLHRLNQAQKDLIPPRGSNFDNWAEDSKARRRAKQKAVRDRQRRVQRTMQRLGLLDLQPIRYEIYDDLTDAIDRNEPITGIIEHAHADGFSKKEILSLLSDAYYSSHIPHTGFHP